MPQAVGGFQLCHPKTLRGARPQGPAPLSPRGRPVRVRCLHARMNCKQAKVQAGEGSRTVHPAANPDGASSRRSGFRSAFAAVTTIHEDVECDGDAYHGPDRWRHDMIRARE